MYQYYHKIEITEHCLRAEEIAGIFGIHTVSGKPHAMLMGALLKEKEATVYYYESSKGLLKGYLFSEYYPIAIEFMKEHANQKQAAIGGKSFKMQLSPKYWSKVDLANKLNDIYRDSKIIM